MKIRWCGTSACPAGGPTRIRLKPVRPPTSGSCRHVHPPPGFRRLEDSLRDDLCAHAVVEGRHAVPFLADGRDELPGLVETKSLRRVAFFRVAGRTGHGEEARGHAASPVSGAAGTGQDGTGRVKPVGGGSDGPVQLADVVITPGPVALGQFSHLEYARGPRFEFGDPGDPVLHVLRFAGPSVPRNARASPEGEGAESGRGVCHLVVL